MAIIRNVVMRGASKRLGGVVFYTRSGETVARELAPSVSNPRTEVQMTQRIKLANVVAAYKANKSWMAGAFEDKAEKESDYNAFVRFNLTDSRVALNKSQAAAGASIAAPYQVTSGSLPMIDCVGQTTGVKSNLYTGNLIIVQSTTVGQFASALIENNNGVQSGMQLSLIVNIQRADGNLVRPYIVARAYEVILDETSTDLLSDFFPLGTLETLDLEKRPLFFNGESLGYGAACFILSKTVSGRLSVSSQKLVQWGSHSLYDFYTSDAAIKAAIQSYGENADRFLDSDRAKAFNPVTLENFVQAVQYFGRLYSNGDSVQIINAEYQPIYYYFAQPIPEDADIEVQINGSPIDLSAWTTQWGIGRSRWSMTQPNGFRFEDGDEVYFAVTYDDTTLDFTFIASVE